MFRQIARITRSVRTVKATGKLQGRKFCVALGRQVGATETGAVQPPPADSSGRAGAIFTLVALGALGGYFYRLSAEASSRKAVIEQLDEQQFLSPDEIRTLRESNAIRYVLFGYYSLI